MSLNVSWMSFFLRPRRRPLTECTGSAKKQMGWGRTDNPSTKFLHWVMPSVETKTGLIRYFVNVPSISLTIRRWSRPFEPFVGSQQRGIAVVPSSVTKKVIITLVAILPSRSSLKSSSTFWTVIGPLIKPIKDPVWEKVSNPFRISISSMQRPQIICSSTRTPLPLLNAAIKDGNLSSNWHKTVWYGWIFGRYLLIVQ